MDIARKRVIILSGMDIQFARRRRSACALAAIAAALHGFGFAEHAIAHEPDANEIALGSLIDAEQAFARLALEQGIRAAFLANFATDGIIFEPEPVRLYEAWSKRPVEADPKSQRLEWQPAQAGVARSRDMGYTTGAFTLTEPAKPERVRRGVFFSVWQRGKEGTWQVVLDAGIVTPQPVDFVPLGAAPRPGYTGRVDATAERRALLAREKGTFATNLQSSGARSYAGLLASDARLHRDGIAPIAGRDAVARHVGERASRIEWSPIDARVARSADLAVTWGRYRETDKSSAVREGYYTHLWLRDAGGRWRIAYDIATPPG
jgi:ketosteroid isomerase-like protein